MDPEASGPSMRPWDQRSAKGLAYSGTPQVSRQDSCIESRTKPPLIFFQTAPSSTSATGTSGLRSSPSTSSPARWPWPSGSTTSPSPPATGPSLGQTVRQEQGFSQTISSPKKAENGSISESPRGSMPVTVMMTPPWFRKKTRDLTSRENSDGRCCIEKQ